MTTTDMLVAHGATTQIPRRIIVHSMSEYFDVEGVRMHAAEFLDSIGLSAHILVNPDGSEVRMRLDGQGAWHAKGFNKDSLGIEVLVEGCWSYAEFLERIKEDWVKPEQYATTVRRCRAWRDDYNITRIDRHSDVAPESKYDPGSGFKWDDFLTWYHYRHGTL